jgi:tetratricopeptide (TPR) repeat protein
MSWKRILRDGLILTALCAAFYFSANAIDGFVESDDRVFSRDRRLADQYFDDRNWEQASFHFQRLTEQDKFNGYAWFQLAVCQLGLRAEIVSEAAAKRVNGATEEELETLELKQSQIEDQVVDSLLQASKFLRHRRRSLVNLAIIYTGRKEWDTAIGYLETYVKEGNLLTRSLEHISSLGIGGKSMVDEPLDENPDVGLHRFPRFWELVELENRNRRGWDRRPANSRPFVP